MGERIDAARGQGPDATSGERDAEAGTTRHVMVIEDNDAIREGFRLALADAGWEVTVFADGRKALEHLRSGGPLPGLILLDLMMPEMDGRQFRREQKAEPALAEIPTLFVTAARSTVPIEGARVLRKPIDLDVLLEIVALELARPRAS